MNYLHLANIGPFIVEAFEERRDTEEAPNPVVHHVSDTFAVRRESDLQSTISKDKGTVKNVRGMLRQRRDLT